MRIAQVAPLFESVPPQYYGGTERVVSYLTEELVRTGHDVTLYASGDSVTSARLRAGCPTALRLQGVSNAVSVAPHLLMIERILADAHQFDLIHFHLDYLPFSHIRGNGLTALSTLHGRQDIPQQFPLYEEFQDMRLISISDSQRLAMPWASWMATVYHGLPEHLYQAHAKSGDYLAFLGRISPEKRVDRAIEIARRAGKKLRIAAKVDPADREYFEQIKGLLDQPHVEFMGEIGESGKKELLGNAAALLFPIDWPEPFGLVMIESMACGTPVIAFDGGSVGEVLDDGVTGFVVDSVEEAVDAVERIPELDRLECRAVFEERFSARRMCHDYVRVYQRLLEEQQSADPLGEAAAA